MELICSHWGWELTGLQQRAIGIDLFPMESGVNSSSVDFQWSHFVSSGLVPTQWSANGINLFL